MMIPNIIPKEQTPFSLPPLFCDSAYNDHNDPVIKLTSQQSVVEPKLKF